MHVTPAMDTRLNPTDSPRTAHQEVRDALRQAILRGSLPSGTRLIQADIAREFGVSTTPVREALRDLVTEGLIDLGPHRGAVVTVLDAEDLREIHELTRMLEPEAVRLTAEYAVDADDLSWLDRAEEIAHRMEATTDVGVWVDLNREFHSALVASLPRRRMLNMLQGLRDAAAPYVGLALRQRGYPHRLANDHHRWLIEAIRAGEGQLAARIAQHHVDLTAETLAQSPALQG